MLVVFRVFGPPYPLDIYHLIFNNKKNLSTSDFVSEGPFWELWITSMVPQGFFLDALYSES